MERDYLELIKLTCISYSFPYTSHPSPLGTIRVLTNGIRAVDLEMTKFVATHQAFIEFTFKGGDPFWRLILCSRKHATISHIFHCLLLHVRRGVGIFSRCASIGIMYKLCGFHMCYKTSFEHQSLMNQRRLSPKNPRCKSP